MGQMRTIIPGTATTPPVTVGMTTCLVRVIDAPTLSASQYLYQEQVILETGASPYRQRFLRLAPHARSHSVESLSYKPAELAAWVGFCDRPLAERQIAMADLGEPICSVFLRPVGDEYWGRTPIDGCPTEVRGAVRSTNTIRLHLVGMDTWDRGFDADGVQVWGAGDRPYEFRWSDH